MKKTICNTANVDKSITTLSLAFQLGRRNYSHMNMYLWDGVELYRYRVVSLLNYIMEPAVSDIYIMKVMDVDGLKRYMEKEELDMIGDWYMISNTSHFCSTSFLDTSRKRKRMQRITLQIMKENIIKEIEHHVIKSKTRW